MIGTNIPAADSSHRSARLYVAALMALVLAACSSGVEKAPETGLQQPQFDEPGERAGSLAVSLSSDARVEAAENLKFSQNELQATIHRILEIQELLTEQPDTALPGIEVTVTSVRVRSTFSAMMFGFLAGDDPIEGDVQVRAPDGTRLQAFKVTASYAFGGFAGGDETRTNAVLTGSFDRAQPEGVHAVSTQRPGTGSLGVIGREPGRL